MKAEAQHRKKLATLQIYQQAFHFVRVIHMLLHITILISHMTRWDVLRKQSSLRFRPGFVLMIGEISFFAYLSRLSAFSRLLKWKF